MKSLEEIQNDTINRINGDVFIKDLKNKHIDRRTKKIVLSLNESEYNLIIALSGRKPLAVFIREIAMKELRTRNIRD